MITAIGKTRDGRRLVILGVTRENVARLVAGRPIHVDAASHPGFLTDIAIAVVFGETEAELAKELRPLVHDETKVVSMLREGRGGKPS